MIARTWSARAASAATPTSHQVAPAAAYGAGHSRVSDCPAHSREVRIDPPQPRNAVENQLEASLSLAVAALRLDVHPGASDWRIRAAGQYTVVRLEADPNVAVGTTPWGPFAAALCPELVEGLSAHSAFAAQPAFLITPERLALPPFQPDQPVLVVGRDIHQHPFARETVDRLRFDHVDALVVDMGWPSADRRYADVATFGASRLMGAVLLKWLAAG
jgi:beta-N-acetylhexosaminidase